MVTRVLTAVPVLLLYRQRIERSQEDRMGAEIIIVPSAFLMIAYVFYVIANAFIRRQQLKSTTDFQTRLLERIGNMGEFSQFLNTEGGQRLLGTMGSDGGFAHHRVLRALQSGIVMMCLGVGIFVYLNAVRPGRDTYEVIGFVGTISAAVGLGLLISGYVSLKLSRRMGLINGKSDAHAAKDLARSA
jgi:hypothetical protein